MQKEERREYSDGKSLYLSKVAVNFLNKCLGEDAIESVDLKYAHINKGVFKITNRTLEKRILVISDMLEHLPDFSIWMSQIRTADYEYIYLQVPVYDNKKAINMDLYGMFIEDHCNYFSEYTVFYMMRLLGYTCANKYMELGGSYNMPMIFPCLVSLWQKKSDIGEQIVFKETDLETYLLQCRGQINAINNFLDKFIDEKLKLAVWGTSNYLQKLLGMTHLSKKNIVCFFDNNVTKIGRQINGIEILKYESWFYDEQIFEKILIASNTVQQEIKDELLNVHGMREEDIITI